MPESRKPDVQDGNGFLVAGMLSALGASACCVGPLVLLALGVSGAWISSLTSLGPYRPIFIGLTLLKGEDSGQLLVVAIPFETHHRTGVRYGNERSPPLSEQSAGSLPRYDARTVSPCQIRGRNTCAVDRN